MDKRAPKAPKVSGDFGHASQVKHINPMPRRDEGKLQKMPYDYRGTPREAFDYKF